MAKQESYTVHFERLGHSVKDRTETFEAADAQDLADQIYHFAGKHLGSKSFEVDVNLETGVGLVEWGRFGRFTIKAGGD